MQEETWRERFDEEFIEKPNPIITREAPYKIGDRHYTGEHILYPSYKIKEGTTAGKLKDFFATEIEKVRKDTLIENQDIVVVTRASLKQQLLEKGPKDEPEGQTEQCKDVLEMNYLIGKNKGVNQSNASWREVIEKL